MVDTVLELTKKLITLPSYDDGKKYEKPVSDFLISYFQKFLPQFTITPIRVSKNRYNLFITDSNPVKLFVVDQIDTVGHIAGWRTDPLKPFVRNGRLYGLGSSDSKGNIAAFLTALRSCGPTNGLSMLWYVDEEYNFAGMKHFVASPLAKKINPENIMSIDGSGLALGLGCRGLTEFDMRVNTESEHSAIKQKQGACEIFYLFLERLHNYLRSLHSEVLGMPTLNIAYIESGCNVGTDAQGRTMYSPAGNRTSNSLYAKLEVRTIPGFNFSDIITSAKNLEMELRGAQKINIKINMLNDYAGFETNISRVKDILPIIKDNLGTARMLDLKKFGFLDVAMLQQIYPKAAIYSFGIGTEYQAHHANEYIAIDNLQGGVKLYQDIVRAIAGS